MKPHKVCTKCNLPKPINHFSKMRGSVRSVCKVCQNRYNKERINVKRVDNEA